MFWLRAKVKVHCTLKTHANVLNNLIYKQKLLSICLSLRPSVCTVCLSMSVLLSVYLYCLAYLSVCLCQRHTLWPAELRYNLVWRFLWNQRPFPLKGILTVFEGTYCYRYASTIGINWWFCIQMGSNITPRCGFTRLITVEDKVAEKTKWRWFFCLFYYYLFLVTAAAV